MKGVFTLALTALLLLALGGLLTLAPWQAAPPGTESFRTIGEVLFGQYLLAFEILSVLLLAALIGAVWMARREAP